jgi:Cu+-exporting ATPase
MVGLPFAAVVLLGSMTMMFVKIGYWFHIVLVVLSVPVVFYTGGHFFIQAFKAARNRVADMNTLVSTGVAGSFGFALVSLFVKSLSSGAMYIDGAVAIIMLVLLGDFIKGRAELSAMKDIFNVASLVPDIAHRKDNDQIIDIPVSELKTDDIIVIRPGERSPADAVILSGSSEIDNSGITGESLPETVNAGDKVFAGSINGFGMLEARCQQVGGTTVISRVIELVSTAIQTKPQVQNLVDKVASYFVPFSITVSVLALNIWYLLGNPITGVVSAISVVVISCPCALGLATPTSIAVALGIASRSGLLVKDARSLENLSEVSTFVFDKTGTLTMGTPEITSVHPIDFDEMELVRLAVSAESGSEHSLAHAVRQHAQKLGLTATNPTSFEAKPGLGLIAEVEGKKIAIGSARLVETLGLSLPMQLLGVFSPEEAVFYIVLDGKVIGGIGLSDPVRPEAKSAISALKALGVESIMVSGDRKEVCESIADKLGIGRVYAQTLPHEKVDVVRSLKESGKVAVMGDGVNDAAALALADSSFAPAAGTGMALDSADVTVMRNDLALVPMAVRLSRRTKKNIRWNLFWAFAYNTLSIPIAAGVLHNLGVPMNPMIASAAMAASSVTVVLNAVSLRSFKVQ